MKKISLENLAKSGCWHSAVPLGEMDGGRLNLFLSDDAAKAFPELAALLEEIPDSQNQSASLFLPAEPNRLAAVIASQPKVIKWIGRRRHPGEAGIGDTLARMLGGETSERFARWFARLGGSSCGCAQAKQWLNEKFPYEKPAPGK